MGSNATIPRPAGTHRPAHNLSGGRATVQWSNIAGWAALVSFLVFSYWPSLTMLFHRWWNEADYSHGFFVPLFAGYLLWYRRNSAPSNGQGSWLGAILILIAGAVRCASLYFSYQLLEPLTLIPCLAGVALLIGGWRAIAWAWPAIIFLAFMVPLPGFLSQSLSHPLQRIATLSSVYTLQTIGVPAVAQGNIIWLTEGQIGVVEACSGLRMLNVFFAVCLGACFLIKRPLWEKALLAGSAIPIGVASNVLRITTTGVIYETAGAELAEAVFHDLAGLLMMPLATGLLLLEMYLLSRLLVEKRRADSLSMELKGG